MNFLPGRKTYLAVIFGIVFQWTGVYLGKIEIKDAINATGEYVIGATIRKGIADASAPSA